MRKLILSGEIEPTYGRNDITVRTYDWGLVPYQNSENYQFQIQTQLDRILSKTRMAHFVRMLRIFLFEFATVYVNALVG